MKSRLREVIKADLISSEAVAEDFITTGDFIEGLNYVEDVPQTFYFSCVRQQFIPSILIFGGGCDIIFLSSLLRSF